MKNIIFSSNNRILFRFICIVSTFSTSVYTYGSELGNFGHNFPVTEIPFEEMILERLSKIDINDLNKDMERRMSAKFYEPEIDLGLSNAKSNRVFKFDPSYVAKEDVILPNGEKLYSKGQKINPLNYLHFDRKLYFIDGDNKRQIEWFRRKIWHSQKETYRLVLVKGSVPKLARIFDMPVYFDQFGHLVNRFGIKNIPAMVWHNKGEKFISIKEVRVIR